MDMESFQASSRGVAIAAIFADRSHIDRMVQHSLADRPAVEAVGREIAARVGDLNYTERKHVGRWVKEILAARGLVPDRKGRVAPGHLFSKGMIYRPLAFSGVPRNSEARLAKARLLVARLASKPQSADGLMAERRAAASSGN